MTKIGDRQQIEKMLRRQGVTQASKVEALVAEVRSDWVPHHPHPHPPKPQGILGGIVVIWQFCLPPEDMLIFHDFLRDNEDFIGTAVRNSMAGADYRGAYMVLSGGEECCRPNAVGACYRVIWSYESLDAMSRAWSPVAKDLTSNLSKAIIELRAFWLRDPQRSEVTIAPAAELLDPKGDAGDGFAKLTLEAAKLAQQPQRSSGRRSRAARKSKKR
jgi:hypothetical protein